MPRYPWPASALSRDHMAMLFQAREQDPKRTPISRLIARAIQRVYLPVQPATPIQTTPEAQPCAQ